MGCPVCDARMRLWTSVFTKVIGMYGKEEVDRSFNSSKMLNDDILLKAVVTANHSCSLFDDKFSCDTEDMCEDDFDDDEEQIHPENN